MRSKYILNMYTIHLTAEIPEHLANQRLDQALAELFPQHSRSRLTGWIKAKQVTVDGKHMRPKDKVHIKQAVEIQATMPIEETWEPQAIDLTIVYEDQDLIVINKPAGMVVHPAAGNPNNTLLNALLYHDAALARLPRAGIIHRLDKGTTGLLVIARTPEAHTHLVDELQSRTINREYETVVIGTIIAGGTIDAPIGRHPTQRKRMAVVESGKPATTHYRVIKRFPAHTHLRVNLETGRTHQIRVHLAHIHHPILGDTTYGGRLKLPSGVRFLRPALG